MVKAWNDLAPDKRQRIDAQYDALARRFRDTVSSLTASGQEHRLPKAPVRNKEATRKDSSGPSGTPKKKTSRDTASVAPSPRQLSASLDSAGLCTSPQDCGIAEQSVASSSGAGGDGQEATGAVRDSRIARLSVFDSELVRHGPLVKRTSWELPAWVHGPSRVPDAERPPSPRARFDNAAPLHATHLVSSAVTRHRASSLRFSLPDEEHSGGASSLLSEQAIFAPPHELPQQQLQQQESPDEWLMREAADLSAASDMPAADVAVGVLGTSLGPSQAHRALTHTPPLPAQSLSRANVSAQILQHDVPEVSAALTPAEMSLADRLERQAAMLHDWHMRGMIMDEPDYVPRVTSQRLALVSRAETASRHSSTDLADPELAQPTQAANTSFVGGRGAQSGRWSESMPRPQAAFMDDCGRDAPSRPEGVPHPTHRRAEGCTS
jgi:hypothetical protein